MPGRIWSRYSTTVTLAPRRRHTDPSSSPITPPPITTMWPGTFGSARAPVESTIASLSISTPGSGHEWRFRSEPKITSLEMDSRAGAVLKTGDVITHVNGKSIRTPEGARAELNEIARRLETEYPEVNEGLGVPLVGLHETVVGDVRPALLVLVIRERVRSQ